MSSRVLALVSLLLFLPLVAQAQVTSLRGKFADVTSNAVVPGVQLKLTSFADSADVHRTTAKDDGTFDLQGLGMHAYRLEATRVGFEPLKIVIRVTQAKQDAGTLALTPSAVNLKGVTITASPAPAVVRNDTTEFRASAVKTNKDATAEELVQKLPGVTVENGQVKTNGENVQQVLVNGKPFFGSDPTAAMRNLPADVIDRIQVFDKGSDQAEFSGFDDGQSQKTMNFILRNQQAKFGKAYGGYGDRDRYQAGGNATYLKGTTRLTLLGLSNNINQQNFSPQDLFGALANGAGGGGMRMMMFGGGRPGGGFRPGGGGPGMMRTGGLGSGFDPGNFFVGQQDGVSRTHSGGLSYTGQWGKRLNVTASSFVNDSRTENTQYLAREYTPPQDSTLLYAQQATTNTKNGNQRFDGRMEWTPDSLNSVILTPRLYFQNTDTDNLSNAANTAIGGNRLSQAFNQTGNVTNGDNLSTHMIVRHRFGKKGRNVSADLGWGHTYKNADASQYALTDYMTGTAASDTVDTRTGAQTLTNNYTARVAFTEPLSKLIQLQATYNPSLSRSTSDARGLRFDALTGAYTRPDSATSNSFANRNTVQSGGLAMLVTHGTWRWLSAAAYQHSELHSVQTYPLTRMVDRTFDDVLPSMTLSGTFQNKANLRLQWQTGTTPPNISQLQNVVDRSNPLSITSGDPELKQSRNQSVQLRFTMADPFKSKSKFLFLNVTRTKDPVGNATFTATRDTLVHGVAVKRGTQYTRPVNLDESWTANAFGVYSRPAAFLKSILSLNSGVTFTRTPALLEQGVNRASTYVIRGGAVIASNASPNLDFTLTYFGSYNLTRNTLASTNTGDYFSHSAGIRVNATLKHGVVFREELSNNLQTGVPGQYGQNVVLWNTTVAKKFLKDDKGEFKVTGTDVLGQDRSVSRSLTESYVQDTRNRTLGRFVQAVVTYSFK